MTRATPKITLPERQSAGDALPDLVYRAILDAMFRGELRRGDLLSEFHLARSLGVSRTPVHSAIRDLVRDGLVVQTSGHRPAVADISRDDLREIFEMRRLLEREAAFRAASQIDRPTLDRLREAISELRQGGDNLLERWSIFDDQFHEAIALSCGQRRLGSDVLRYRKIHYALNSIRMTEDLVPQALDEHEAILDALARRDPQAAREAMERHLQEWQAYYVSLFA